MPNITIPVAEAIVDYEYTWCHCEHENGMSSTHGPSITYKGNGIGWSYNNPKDVIKNIVSLDRPMTWEEEKEFYKNEYFDESNRRSNQLNLFGLFNDCYAQGEREMYNGWVSYDFYEMCKRLNDENWIIVGIAEAPWKWSLDDPCVAIVVENIDGDRFWCHAHKSWIDDMRDCMKADYEKLLEKGRG